MGDTWYLDDLFVTIEARRQCLWRAVDQDGYVTVPAPGFFRLGTGILASRTRPPCQAPP